MQEKANFGVLLVGLIRPLLWATGIYLTATYSNWFAFVGCVLSLFVSIPVAFQLAGYGVSGGILQAASILATPGTMFLVAGIAYSARNHKALRCYVDRLIEDLRKK